jgi:hypothetical protein
MILTELIDNIKSLAILRNYLVKTENKVLYFYKNNPRFFGLFFDSVLIGHLEICEDLKTLILTIPPSTSPMIEYYQSELKKIITSIVEIDTNYKLT